MGAQEYRDGCRAAAWDPAKRLTDVNKNPKGALCGWEGLNGDGELGPYLISEGRVASKGLGSSQKHPSA